MVVRNLAEYTSADGFQIQVPLESIAPLLSRFADGSKDLRYWSSGGYGTICLYQNPPNTAQALVHNKRGRTFGNILKSQKLPDAFHETYKLLTNEKVQPVMKITEPLEVGRPEPRTFVVKMNHNSNCDASPRSEGILTAVAGELKVGPEVKGMYNPELSPFWITIEDYVSPKQWKPLSNYFGSVNEVLMPEPFGETIGSLHNVCKVQVGRKHRPVYGRLLLNDSPVPHAYWNEGLQKFILVDFGEMELVTEEMLMKPEYQRKFMEEALFFSRGLFYVSRGFMTGVSQTDEKTGELQKEFVGKYLDGYRKASGVDLNFGLKDVIEGRKKDELPRQEYRKYAGVRDRVKGIADIDEIARKKFGTTGKGSVPEDIIERDLRQISI